MRRTLANALDPSSRICEALNIPPSDARVKNYINRAQERLLTRGHWWGTTQIYTVSVSEQLFTLPPQFAAMEKISISGIPVSLRNEWYQFQQNCIGTVPNPNTAPSNLPIVDTGGQALFRGNFPSFKDITSGHLLRLQCDVAADVGTQVLVLGWDSNNNWVRTQTAGVWHDGEYITLAQSPGTLSATAWSRITDIQKPVTNGQIWGYDWDGSTNTLIGNWLHWETNPAYQRYLLPTLPGTATQIDLVGKLGFYPVINNTDYLLIGNLEALRLAVMAVKLEEAQQFSAASTYLNGGMLKNGVRIEGAVPILEAELQHYTGSGFEFSVQIKTQFGEPVQEYI